MVNRWGNSDRLYFLGLQNHCSHEIKRHLLPGRKDLTNLDSILKSKDITLPTKVHVVKATDFPIVMYGYKSWTIKKADTKELLLLNWIELLNWESLGLQEIKLVDPKGKQSWIFMGRTDAEAEASILWPPDAKNWLIVKTMLLGKIEGRKTREWQRMRWLDGITDSMDMSWASSERWWRIGKPGVLLSMGSQKLDMTERLNNSKVEL